MEWEGIVVLVSLFLGLGLLAFDIVSAEVVFLSELVFFWNLGIIDDKDALIGFSNRGLIAIGALYIIVSPLSSNRYLNIVFKRMLNGENMRISMMRVCMVVAVLSAFLNNTPLVQLLTPIIRKYSRTMRFPTSRFLMPISFSSIIGGMMTLIGSSTNIIIISLLPIKVGFFEPALLGLPILVVYLVYNYFLNERLLPIRSGLYREVKNNFYVNIRSKNGKCIRDIVEDFGITLDDVIGVVHGDMYMDLEGYVGGDYLCLRVSVDMVRSVVMEEEYEIMDCDIKDHNSFYECVVGNVSNMDKKTFEHKYNCRILASRQAEGAIGKGTTLLVIGRDDFYKLWHSSSDFYMISLFNNDEMNDKKLPILIFIVMISLAASGIIGIEKVGLTAVVLYIWFGILDIKEALKLVNYGLLLVIGCSFGIARAMERSGLSGGIALMVGRIGGDGFEVFLVMQLITQILTEVISNNAVAALMTQIVVDVCGDNGYDMRIFVLGLMVSCSSSFVTPYGYATNLIIQGSGGYKFMDYMRYGITVKILALLVSVLMYIISI